MSRPPRWLGVWALVGLAVSCSTGCGPGEGRDHVELELWTLSLRPTFSAYMEERVRAFEDAHPGVRVRWVDVPFSAVERKLIAAAAAGRSPDVINLSDRMLARIAAAGALADLRPLLPAGAEDEYLPGALRVAETCGELLALPWYLTTQAQLVNTDLLSRAGLSADELPADWAGLRELAPSFHERTGAFLFTVPLGQESLIPMMMLADGIVPFREEGGRVRADLRRPEAAAYVHAWVDFYRSGAMPREAATKDHAHLTELYQNARVALINTGPNFLGRMKNESPRVFAATEVRPAVTGSLARDHIAVMVLAVTATSEHPLEAAALAASLTGPAAQLEFCRLVNIMPSTPSVLTDGLFSHAGGDDPVASSRVMLARTLPDAVAFTPSMECWPDMRRVFEEHITRALLGSVATDEALRVIEGEWDRLLQEADDARERRGVAPIALDVVPSPPPASRGAR